jgi:hypothetical protein
MICLPACAQVITAHPPVLSYNVPARLQPFWEYMMSIGVPDVAAAVAKRPSLLGLDVDANLRKIVDYLQVGLGLRCSSFSKTNGLRAVVQTHTSKRQACVWNGEVLTYVVILGCALCLVLPYLYCSLLVLVQVVCDCQTSR